MLRVTRSRGVPKHIRTYRALDLAASIHHSESAGSDWRVRPSASPPSKSRASWPDRSDSTRARDGVRRSTPPESLRGSNLYHFRGSPQRHLVGAPNSTASPTTIELLPIPVSSRDWVSATFTARQMATLDITRQTILNRRAWLTLSVTICISHDTEAP